MGEKRLGSNNELTVMTGETFSYGHSCQENLTLEVRIRMLNPYLCCYACSQNFEVNDLNPLQLVTQVPSL